MIGGESAAILAFVLRVDRRQIQLVHDVGNEASKVVLGKPFLQRRRKKEQLIQTTRAETFVHAVIMHVPKSVVKYPSWFYLRQAPRLTLRLPGFVFSLVE